MHHQAGWRSTVLDLKAIYTFVCVCVCPSAAATNNSWKEIKRNDNNDQSCCRILLSLPATFRSFESTFRVSWLPVTTPQLSSLTVSIKLMQKFILNH